MDAPRYARLAPIAGIILTLGSCGGGSDAGKTASGDGGPELQHDVAIDGNLRIHGVHYHQDFYHHSFAPNSLIFYWDVFNTSGTDLTGVAWTITRLDGGAVVARGTLAAPAHYIAGDDGIRGTGHDISVAYTEPEVGTHDYQLTIDGTNRVKESDENDNTYIMRVAVPGDPGQSNPQNDLHFRAREAHFHDYAPGLGNLDFHFVAENTFAVPVSGVKWRLRCAAIGFDETYTVPGAIAAGATFEESHGINVGPGEYDVEMTLDPGNDFPESDEGDNSRLFHVVVPPASGG